MTDHVSLLSSAQPYINFVYFHKVKDKSCYLKHSFITYLKDSLQYESNSSENTSNQVFS